MQKLKEWIEKDKDPEELIPDLTKSYSKSLPRLLEMLHECLTTPDSLNVDTSDSSKLRSTVSTLGLYLRRILSQIPSGEHTLDLGLIESPISSILLHKWTASHALIASDYDCLKKLVTDSLCIFLKHLIKLLGTRCISPKVLRMVRGLAASTGLQVCTIAMLNKFLEALGSSATDIVEEYMRKNGVVEKTIEQLRVMTYEETVTLGLCKKDKKKKMGNAHQRRNHKVIMKKTENRKLRAMVEDNTQAPETEVVMANLGLITQYLVASPVVTPDLDGLFTMQLQKLTPDLQFVIVQLMFYYAVAVKKHYKKVKSILQSLIKNIEYRNTYRHYLFLLDNLNN